MQLRRARGFALLEALLAMALFASAGLAALWSLQHTAQQQRQQLLQSTAMLLAQDLSERMFVNAHQTALYARTWQSQTPISASDCTQQLCTASALAAWDLQQWLDLVRKQLPQGDAQIQPMPYQSHIRMYRRYSDLCQYAFHLHLHSTNAVLLLCN